MERKFSGKHSPVLDSDNSPAPPEPKPDSATPIPPPDPDSTQPDHKSDQVTDQEEPSENADVAADKPEETPEIQCTLESVSEEIDQFLLSFSGGAAKEESKDGEEEKDGKEAVAVVEVPSFVEKFLDLVEERIAKRDANDGKSKQWCQVPEDDESFLEAVNRVAKLIASLDHLKSSSSPDPNQAATRIFNRLGGIQQRAMSHLEEEFRLLLEDMGPVPEPDPKGGDRCTLPETETPKEDNFMGYSENVLSSLKRIAKEMIEGGFESECCQIYMIVRRQAFDDCLNKIGFENISIDEVQRMQWDALEREIPSWIKTFKDCATIYFSKERKLAENVFAEFPSIASSHFNNLTRGVVIHLLNFAEGVAMTKRSAEKLFKFLDMYETLRDSIPAMDGLFPEECENELKTETFSARSRIGEAAICIFCDLENSIKSDTGKTPVPGGAVHPLTRYTMNYLKYACDQYMATLEQVFREHSKIERADSTSRPHFESEAQESNENSHENHPQNNLSPFSNQLTRVMDLLDSNLEGKSKLYRDVPLSCIFMMNNGRYILQKIKGSSEIHQVMGDTWCRKKSSDLRNYHKNYQRETWGKLLGCLGDKGLQVNGKVVKPVLKERFKSFNLMFDEIHKTQSTWVISDEQLQSELRVSISSVMIPAYRSFLGRFSQYLDPGRQYEKYIKYQPDDIETYIDELFDGKK